MGKRGPKLFTDAERLASFMAKVEIVGECWIWTGALTRGYGKFGVGGRKTMLAHRWSHEHFIGPIPDGYQVDHVKDRGCTSTACVRPEHLEAVTPLVNTRRALPWVNGQARRTHCPRDHEYTEANTRRDPNGSRHCRTCDQERIAARSERRRLARAS